jgi:protein-tyrosine-phosphatase
VSVLFVYTGNSARSPIAEALLRRHDTGDITVASARTRPRDDLHPHAVRVLRDRTGSTFRGTARNTSTPQALPFTT